MVACTNIDYAPAFRRIDNSYKRISISSVYLCDILKPLQTSPKGRPLDVFHNVHYIMKKEKLTIKKKKKRIPLPQKPPKVEEDPKAYKRKKEKEKLRKKIDEETSSNG